MNRRNYLRAAVLSSGTLASGCSRLGIGGEPQPPEFEVVTPVTRRFEGAWNGDGVVEEYGVDAFGSGGEIVVGYRFTLPVTDGSAAFSIEAEVLDDGDVVDRHSTGPQRNADAEGVVTPEVWISFGNRPDWPRKEYDLASTVRDLETDRSTTHDLTFALNRPLTGDEARIAGREIPDDVGVGESVEEVLRFENRSNRDSSIYTTVSTRWGTDGEWTAAAGTLSLNVASDRLRTWRHTVSFDRAGTRQVRFDDIDEVIEWQISE